MLHRVTMSLYDLSMSALFTLAIIFGTLALFVAGAWLIRREVRRHHRELAVRNRLLELARPILQSATCASCGGALSTWDGGLRPLPEGKHVAPAHIPRQGVAEYEARRECLGCRHQFVLWLWSDGTNWGFTEAEKE